jgi:hypothetical protein
MIGLKLPFGKFPYPAVDVKAMLYSPLDDEWLVNIVTHSYPNEEGRSF